MARSFFHSTLSPSVIICLVLTTAIPARLRAPRSSHHCIPSVVSGTASDTDEWFKKYLLSEFTATEGLAPRVSRLNCGMREGRVVLRSLFHADNLLREVHQAISLSPFSFSPPARMTLLKTTSLKDFLRFPSVKVIRCSSVVLYPIWAFKSPRELLNNVHAKGPTN